MPSLTWTSDTVPKNLKLLPTNLCIDTFNRHKPYHDPNIIRLISTCKRNFKAIALSNSNPRHLPCALLRSQGIRYVVWFKDAIAHYKVPTIIFNLYVLMQDPTSTAKLLLQSGWTFMQREQKIGNATLAYMQYALSPPAQNSIRRAGELLGPITTVLLRANNWNFNLKQHCSPATIIPPLAPLLDALINSQLNSPNDNLMLRMHLGYIIAYLYNYAPELQQETFIV